MTGGDSMDRYYCHIKEMYQSLDIIEQLIDNIPEGEFYIKQKPIIKVPEDNGTSLLKEQVANLAHTSIQEETRAHIA